MLRMSNQTINAWHEFVRTKKPALLKQLLAENVQFHSPVVHTPQSGKAITLMYLMAALDVFSDNSFHYQRELLGDEFAVLEFSAEINGIVINGVDMITWDAEGKITDFKVMIRPLQAIKVIQDEMAMRLQAKA
jgi:hypothetical protein